MIQIYLLRHGETRFNVEEIVQGWNDSPLTKLGLYQAKCCGYGLKDTAFTIAFSGDAPRQIKTAETFMQENVNPCKIIADYHFREMRYGKYEGRSYKEMLDPLFRMHHEEYCGHTDLYRYYNDIEIGNMLLERDETGTFEGAENAWERLSEGLTKICEEYKEGNILISTSSYVICTILYHLFPELKQHGFVKNASITVLSFNGSFHLLEYDNVEYRKAGENHYPFYGDKK